MTPEQQALNPAPLESKIPLITIQCDDCVVKTGMVIQDGKIVDEGVAHHVHGGEWIKVIPVQSVAETIAIGRLTAPKKGATSGEALSDLADHFDTLRNELSQRIVEWNWTDLMGQPLPQPYQRPDVLGGLTNEELFYLMGAAQGREPTDDRKKDSEQSASAS